MGDERRGALMVNLLVTFVSRDTSDAGKSIQCVRYSNSIDPGGSLTDRPGENEKVIVSQSTVTIRVE